MRLSRTGIRAVAMTSSTLILAILNVFVFPKLDSSEDTLLKIIAVFSQVIGLGALVSLIDWLILRLWIDKFKGEWFYTSKSDSIDPNGHVGYVKFFIRGGDIKYLVNLFSWETTTRLAKGDLAAAAEAKGTANPEVVLFDGEDPIKILYNFTPLEGDGGLGVLDLTGAQNGHAMTGAWVTARRQDKGPSDGKQQWFRRSEFLEYVLREFPNGFPNTKAKK